jgi:adenylate kinase family enzyme
LVDDATVVMAVFEELLRPENTSGAVIDGFPRTQVQALCLKMLARRLETDETNRWCFIKIVNFEISRDGSIDRQLSRGDWR